MSSIGGSWIIMSGAYVGAELAAEFGSLPPAFLPIGTSRLYEYHVDRLGSQRPIFLTIPESFELSTEDRRRLDELSVVLLPLPEGLSLGEAVVYAINSVGIAEQPVRILHGDTLIDDMPLDRLDIMAVAGLPDGYSWAEVDISGDRVRGLETVTAGSERDSGRPVAAGYFSFSSTRSLVRAITRARGDFVAGINRYVQERVVEPLRVDSWLDFGHAQTYFRSRRAVSTARAFNTLRLDGRTARKQSLDGQKMNAEARWLREVPPAVQLFTVRVLDSGEDNGQSFYETEYQYLPTLSELFVFGSLRRSIWSRIMASCAEFMRICAHVAEPTGLLAPVRQLAIEKTSARLEAFAKTSGFDVDQPLNLGGRPFPSLADIADRLTTILNGASSRVATIMHGDFCFSNILYDSRTQRIKVIDPRGYTHSGQPTIYGDGRYDLAKMAHSIVGRYDHIIAGRYTMSASDGYRLSINFERTSQQAWLEDMLTDVTVNDLGVSNLEIHAIMVSLFLSMLPLHADRPDRQRAFIANALRLYGTLESIPA